MTDSILIDADDDYEVPQLSTCKVRIGGTIYAVTPRDDRALEALLEAATDVMDADKAIDALYQCLSKDDAKQVRVALAEGEAYDEDEDGDDTDAESRVTRGKLRYVVQKLILHYQGEMSAHFKALAKKANSPTNAAPRTPAARSSRSAVRRTAAAKKTT